MGLVRSGSIALGAGLALFSAPGIVAPRFFGRLVGLTARGWFHIRWLHLNRALLISFRQLRQRDQLRETAQIPRWLVARFALMCYPHFR